MKLARIEKRQEACGKPHGAYGGGQGRAAWHSLGGEHT